MMGRRDRALDWLASAGRPFVWTLSILLIAAVSIADWFSGAEVAASLVYLLPIALMAWGGGRAAASTVAVVCAVAWLAVDFGTHGDDIVTTLKVIDLIVLTITFVLFGQLLAALRSRLERERHLAHTDPLTGVHNRRAFWSAAARELERCRRQHEPFSLAYLDLDGFKAVNDQHGHGVGDDLLRAVAGTLQQDLRQLDMLARLGGDEFALLLPGTDGPGAAAAMQRLRERLQRAPWRQGHDLDCSIGCLTVVLAPADVSDIIARADQMMYAMKRAGRGRTLHEVVGSTAASATVRVAPRRPPVDRPVD